MLGVSDRGPAADAKDERRAITTLRKLIVVAGVACAVLFAVIGLVFQFELYGDGALFSYAVAVQDSWQFHWHNISNRATVYLFAHWPAEYYAQVTGDARGAVHFYGLLFFSAQFLGLAVTYLLDRTPRHILFTFGCLSTAVLCPLIFAAPSEMWFAHALFWSALAAAHSVSRPWLSLATFVTFLALAFSHEGGVVFIAAILFSIAIRRGEWPRLFYCLAATAVVLAIWIFVRIKLQPDEYTARVLHAAAWNLLNPEIFLDRVLLLLASSAGGFLVLFLAMRRAGVSQAIPISCLIVALILTAYWYFGDHDLHASHRYYLRTIVIIFTPVLGAMAVCVAFQSDLVAVVRRLWSIPRAIFAYFGATAMTAVLFLTIGVHSVETARFADAWEDHLTLFRKLISESARSRFVEMDPENPQYEELPWFSTLPYLSVLVAPDFRPARLAIDPRSDYFWISCATATASVKKAGAKGIPARSRELIREYTCRHRRK